ncbi:MAG: heat-inducible transcriptional repressor HrcA [Spirochaetota bacterium]|nr:heat-inducible transcriptional repressor HrcA [Spirochaetota bacterium]
MSRPLTDRESDILRAIVYDYISTGKPVGSRSFVQKYSFAISPATMRNIMFDLESLGYLVQPHTSSGRVPTDKGYRFYVDMLLDSYDFESAKKTRTREIFKDDLIRREFHLDKMFLSVSKMLSIASRYAGVVLTPLPDFTVVKHIELINLDNNEILFILVTRTGMIFTKKVIISSNITKNELFVCSNYLTSELCGYSLSEIKGSIFDKLRGQRGIRSNDEIALDITELALSRNEEPDLFIDGIENLLHIQEMVETERLNSLLHIIEEKSKLKSIMEKNLDFEGVITLIGEEINEVDITGCSIVTSAYKIGSKNVGVVAILGPTRMDYEKVVPLVDYAGRMVSDLLTNISE